MEFGKVIKTFKSKKGNDVIIRYPREEDLDEMLRYVNELIADDTYVLISGNPQTKEEEVKFLNQLLTDIQYGNALSLVIEQNGRIVGMTGVAREKFRMRHVGMLGISLAAGVRGEGIGTMAFSTIIEESKKMELRLLTLHCFENNSRALHMYEKFGFVRVGMIPKAVLFREKYIGQIIMYLPLVK